MIAAVVLAAGASTRLGEPKQLIAIGGETLLERAVRTAREAGCAPVVVVLGADAERIRERCDLGDALAVVNEEWQEGMASSIRIGVAARTRCGWRGVDDLRPAGGDGRSSAKTDGDRRGDGVSVCGAARRSGVLSGGSVSGADAVARRCGRTRFAARRGDGGVGRR